MFLVLLMLFRVSLDISYQEYVFVTIVILGLVIL